MVSTDPSAPLAPPGEPGATAATVGMTTQRCGRIIARARCVREFGSPKAHVKMFTRQKSSKDGIWLQWVASHDARINSTSKFGNDVTPGAPSFSRHAVGFALS